jgi:hypothetical protein
VAHGEEVRVEDLVGRRILAPDGSVAGRIEEMRAVREEDHFVIADFRIGPRALLERMAIRHFGWAVPRRFQGYRVRWDQLDLTDVHQPRLVCELSELEHTS